MKHNMHNKENNYTYRRASTAMVVAAGPETLIEGMADYFVLQSQHATNNAEIGFSPSKKCGWQLITKAIFNP